MAVLKINTLEGGTDGVNISNANSGGASFDNLTNITVGTSHSLKYATGAAMAGSMGMRIVAGATAAQTFLEEAFASQSEIAGTLFIKESLALVSFRPLRVFGTAGQTSGLVGSIQITNTGIVRWLDSGGAVRGSIATAISISTAYRIAYHVKPGTVGGNDTQVELYLYDAAGTTLIDSATTTVADTLSTDITNCRYGITGQNAASFTVDFDYLRVDSGATVPTGPQSFTGTTLINQLTSGPRGVGALTAAGASTADGSATIGGVGALSGGAGIIIDGSGSAGGAGSLAGAGDVPASPNQARLFETHIHYETAVIWGGTPTNFTDVDAGVVAIGGTGSVTCSGFGIRQGSSNPQALGALTGSGRGETTGAASPSGTGALAATARAESSGTATLPAVGSIDAAGSPVQVGSAHLVGAGALTHTSEPQERLAEATIGGTGSVTATIGLRTAFATAVPTGVGSLIFGEVFAGPPDPPRQGVAEWEPRPPAWDVLAPNLDAYPAPSLREVDWASLDAAGRVAYARALRYSRRTRARVLILDPDENPIVDLAAEDAVVYDGSVQIDATQAVARRLSLAIADPTRQLVSFDASGANLAPIAPGGFCHVERIDEVPELGLFVSVPIFHGSISLFSRTGPDVTLEGLGKESRLGGSSTLAAAITIGKGTRIVDAIRRLAGRMGETRFKLPEASERLQSPLSLVRGQGVWGTIKRLGDTLGRDVYYDADGFLTARVTPTSPAWAFTDSGEDSNIMPPGADVAYDMTAVRNAVLVLGRIPTKGKRPSWLAVAPADHPLSPQSLARNGRPTYLFERVEADHLTRISEVQARARTLLASYLIAGTSASFDAAVNPLTEVRDVASLSAGGLLATFRITQATLPLAGGSMTIGDVRRVPNRRRRKARAGVRQ